MDEETPLLSGSNQDDLEQNIHRHFCLLVGMEPSDAAAQKKRSSPGQHTLYGRVLKRRRAQNFTCAFTATLSNTLLHSQHWVLARALIFLLLFSALSILSSRA